MICPRCNTNLPDGTAVCTVCSMVLSQDGEQGGAVNKKDKKEEKVYYGYGKEFSKTKYNKRKRRRRVWSVIIPATLVVVLAALVLFNLDFINGFYKKTFCSPDEYFEYVARRNMGDDYSDSAREYLSDVTASVNGAVDIKFDKDVYEAYRKAYDERNANWVDPSYGIDGLDKLYVKAVSDSDSTGLGIYTGDRLHTVFDLVGKPDDKSDKVPVKIESGYFVFYDCKVTAAELEAALPSEKELDKLTEKYLDIFYDHCTGVKKATEEFNIGGVYQKLVMLEVNFGRSDMLTFKKELLTELKKDKTVRELLVNIEKTAQKSGTAADGSDILAQFDAELEAELGDIEEARTDVSILVNTLRYRIFVDDGHGIVGHEITVQDKREFYYLVVRDKEEFGIEFKLDTMVGTGYGTMEDGVANGTISAEDDGVEMLDIEIKGIEMKNDGIVGGKLIFTPETRLIHDTNLPTDFSRLGVACEISFGEDKTMYYIKSTVEEQADE